MTASRVATKRRERNPYWRTRERTSRFKERPQLVGDNGFKFFQKHGSKDEGTRGAGTRKVFVFWDGKIIVLFYGQMKVLWPRKER